jgi:hypothetical protein
MPDDEVPPVADDEEPLIPDDEVPEALPLAGVDEEVAPELPELPVLLSLVEPGELVELGELQAASANAMMLPRTTPWNL